jgi:hypothetical protein
MTIKYVTNRTKHKCCCSCKHNIRTRTDDVHVKCNCELDGHYIGYVENFEQTCDEWTRDEWKRDQPCGS